VLEQTTTVPTPWWARLLAWLGLTGAGAGLVLIAVRVVDRLPLPGPLALIRHLPAAAGTAGALAAGAVLGLVLAAVVDREALTVRIGTAEVVLIRPGGTRTVPRSDVAVAFTDRDRLVLLGRTGRELARVPCHLSGKRLRAAFTAYGIAWSDRDPYLEAYRRWVPGLPEVPAAADALFVARQAALRAGDQGDAQELREELGLLGFVVRDDHKRQHWRRADG
jgi:hypothetical protein